MIATVKIKTEIDIKYVLVEAAVRYEEEDIPNDFPFRVGDMWKALIDIDRGAVVDWPQGQKGSLHMKVCDEGTYTLMDQFKTPIKTLENEYVPNDLLPGDYGDYLHLEINEFGTITNWYSQPSFDNFFTDED